MSSIRAAAAKRDRPHIVKKKRRAVVEFLACASHDGTIEAIIRHANSSRI